MLVACCYGPHSTVRVCCMRCTVHSLWCTVVLRPMCYGLPSTVTLTRDECADNQGIRSCWGNPGGRWCLGDGTDAGWCWGMDGMLASAGACTWCMEGVRRWWVRADQWGMRLGAGRGVSKGCRAGADQHPVVRLAKGAPLVRLGGGGGVSTVYTPGVHLLHPLLTPPPGAGALSSLAPLPGAGGRGALVGAAGSHQHGWPSRRGSVPIPPCPSSNHAPIHHTPFHILRAVADPAIPDLEPCALPRNQAPIQPARPSAARLTSASQPSTQPAMSLTGSMPTGALLCSYVHARIRPGRGPCIWVIFGWTRSLIQRKWPGCVGRVR